MKARMEADIAVLVDVFDPPMVPEANKASVAELHGFMDNL